MIDARPQSPVKAPGRIEYADAMRLMAVVMVVCIHVAGPLLLTTPGTKKWLFANLLDSISRPAVPLFLMLSGMLLLPPERIAPLKVFYKRRFARVAAPLLGWSLIYFFWRSFINNQPLNWQTFIPDLLNGNIYYHLAFIYILFGLYFLVPFLQQFTCIAKDRDYLYILSFWIACVAIAPLFSKYLNWTINVNLRTMAGYIGYFIAGYYLTRVPEIRTRYLLAVLILANVVTFFGTLFLSQASGQLDQFYYGYLSLNCILAAFAWFLLFQKIPFEKVYARVPWLKQVIVVGSSISFSIYLMHILVLELLGSGKLGFVLVAKTINPIFGVTISMVAALAICTVVILVMRRIPFLRWLFA